MSNVAGFELEPEAAVFVTDLVDAESLIFAEVCFVVAMAMLVLEEFAEESVCFVGYLKQNVGLRLAYSDMEFELEFAVPQAALGVEEYWEQQQMLWW